MENIQDFYAEVLEVEDHFVSVLMVKVDEKDEKIFTEIVLPSPNEITGNPDLAIGNILLVTAQFNGKTVTAARCINQPETYRHLFKPNKDIFEDVKMSAFFHPDPPDTSKGEYTEELKRAYEFVALSIIMDYSHVKNKYEEDGHVDGHLFMMHHHLDRLRHLMDSIHGKLKRPIAQYIKILICLHPINKDTESIKEVFKYIRP